MSLENTNLQGGIPLGAGFKYQAEAPIDKRFIVKNKTGLDELVSEHAAYNGLQVYVEKTQNTYRFVNGNWEKVLEEADIKDLINENAVNAMEYMGVVETLPTGLEEKDKGHFYKVSNDITIEGAAINIPVNKVLTVDTTDNVSDASNIPNGAVSNNVLSIDLEGYNVPQTAKKVVIDYEVIDDGNYQVGFITSSQHYDGEWANQEEYRTNESGYELFGSTITLQVCLVNFSESTGFENEIKDPVSLNIKSIHIFLSDPVSAKVGDAIIWDGTQWQVIPSGDDIEDTWRPIEIEGQDIGSQSALNLKQGSNVQFSVVDGGDVTISAIDTKYTADGTSLTLNNTTFSIKEEGVQNKHLANNSVAASNLQQNSVVTDKINDGAVTDAKLADSAVKRDKIADGAVTEGKLESNLKNAIGAVGNKLNANGWTDNDDDNSDGWKYEDESGRTAEITPESISSIYGYDGYEIDSSGFSLKQAKTTDSGTTVSAETKVTHTGISQNDGTQTTQYNYPTQGGTLVVKENLHKIATSGSIYEVKENAVEENGAIRYPQYLVFNCGSSTILVD